MSNRRKSGFRNAYRAEFLRSSVWHARRDQWFAHHARRGAPLACAGCGRDAKPSDVELHHLAYTGVIRRNGRWIAAERDQDLIPLHPYCHELLHRLMDRDAVLAKHRDRTRASISALVRLRRALIGTSHV